MAIDKIRARLGSISPTKLDAIYTLSKSAHKILTEDFPKLLAVVEAADRFANADLLGMSILRTEDLANLKAALAELDK